MTTGDTARRLREAIDNVIGFIDHIEWTADSTEREANDLMHELEEACEAALVRESEVTVEGDELSTVDLADLEAWRSWQAQGKNLAAALVRADVEPATNPLTHELHDLIKLMPDSQVDELLAFVKTLREARHLAAPVAGHPPAEPLELLRELVVAYQEGTKPRANNRAERKEVAAVQGTLAVILARIDELRAGVAVPHPQDPHLGEVLQSLGLVSDATVASVQRRLHVDAANAMRLLALREEISSRQWGVAVPASPPQEQAIAALKQILAHPYGCRFCDSGVLRKPGNPHKQHDDDCGWLLAQAAIEALAGVPSPQPRTPCNDESEVYCNPFEASCGAKFCSYDDMAHHEKKKHAAAPPQEPTKEPQR